MLRTAAFKLIAFALFAVAFAACSPHGLSGNFAVSEEFARKLIPNTPVAKTQDQQPEPYEVLDVTLGKVDAKTGRLTGVIRVAHFGESESIDVFGTIDSNGKADLVELHPPAPDQQRVTASLYCADQLVRQSCEKSIVNVYFRVSGKIHMKQFVANELIHAPAPPPGASPPPTDDSTDGSLNDDDTTTEEGLEQDPDQPSANSASGIFVGAQRNEVMIGRLVDHPDHPGTPDKSHNAPAPSPSPHASSPPATKNPETKPSPSPSPQGSDDDKDDGSDDSSPKSPPSPVTPAPHPSHPHQPPVAKPAEPPPLPAKESEPEVPSDSGQDKIAELEKRIAPFVDFHSGGQAVGFYSHGTLRNAATLPQSGTGFKRYTPTSMAYATGMMLSVLQNGSKQFLTMFPDLFVWVGSLALQTGGHFSPHDSHQNGLDVDIRYIGTSAPGSVVNLSAQSITPDLHPDAVWAFIKMIASQQMVEMGKRRSILDRIFVHPVVKRTLCEWAIKNHMMNDPLNREIMTRLRPTAQTVSRNGHAVASPNHHDHFHLRLRCSPYYPLCTNPVADPDVLGCGSDQ